jgi:hypothetical protein
MTITLDTPPLTVDASVLADAVELIGTQHEREREAFNRGYNLGRADACVALAEMEARRERAEQWRDWAAALKEAKADPGFMCEAHVKAKTEPWKLTPLEWAALRNVRLAPLADSEIR